MYRSCSRCILLNADDEILFLQHNPSSQFSLPGGHVEEWEDLYTALEREIKEELWFQIKMLWKKTWVEKYTHIQEFPLPLYVQKITYTSPKHWLQHKLEYFFLAQVVWWNFKLQTEEIINYKWVKFDEFQSNWLISHLTTVSKNLNIYENVVEIVTKNRELIKSLIME